METLFLILNLKVSSLGFVCTKSSSANIEDFVYFPVVMPLSSVSCLTVLAKTLRTMLNNSGYSEST